MTGMVPPIEWGRPEHELEEVLPAPRTAVGPAALSRLQATGAQVRTDAEAAATASRDWWPLAQRWALRGRAPARPAVVVRPNDVAQLAAVLALADEEAIPVTVAGGRSGVCGGAVPLFGGIALDCLALAGLQEVDEASLLVTAGAGTFGPDLEASLQDGYGLSVGHLPQSIDISTVGGWLACRGAGQYSTRYGKIEDLVAGLEVVLADGRVVRTGAMAGAGPRSAAGPDLTQLFVGSEGTLGVITAARLRAHPLPVGELRRAWSFPSFAAGIEALRLTLRAGATPAVVRLYDRAESARTLKVEHANVLVALDEGEPALVEATMGVLGAACAEAGAGTLPESLVGTWLEHRNDVSALAALTRAGIVVDTVEVAAPWSQLPALYEDALAGLSSVEGCLSASAHESHAYPDGACLYFTFAGRGAVPDDDGWASAYYAASWDAVMGAARRHGASISHHHGIGLVRGPYLEDALGEGFGVLRRLKEALDPRGILNPGKLGLASPFGAAPAIGRMP